MRLVHWAIVVLFALSVASGLAGHFRVHFLSGYALLALVLFRIAWGFVGSQTARFTAFLRGPKAVLRLAFRLPPAVALMPPRATTPLAAGRWWRCWTLLLLQSGQRVVCQ